MSNFIKISALAATLVLSGCVVDAGSANSAQAKGEKAGSLVVFSTDNLGGNTVAISVNDHFIAPLQAKKQFTQGLCSGNYQLSARSVKPFMQGNNVVRVIGTKQIQIAPKRTTYVELSNTGNGWKLETVSQETWKAKTGGLTSNSTDGKIVRRVTSNLVNCK